MPDNKPVVATTGSMQLFSGNSTSVSSATNSGIPILGLDTINEKEPRVNNELPQGTPNDIEYKPYGWDELGKLTQDSYAISPFGMFYRQAKNGTGEFWESYKPSIAELDKIYKQVGTDEDVLDVVLRGADTYEEVGKNIALYKQNLEIERRIANSPWYWQLYSGIVGAFGNPVDLGTMALTAVVPPAGAVLGVSAKAAKAVDIGGRIAANVVSGVAANQVAGEVSGLETDVWRDVAAITTLSGAMEVAGYAAAKLRASKIKGVLAHDKYVTNGEKPKAIGDFAPEIEKVTKSKGFTTKLNDMREQLTSGLPSVEVKQRLLEYDKEGLDSVSFLIRNITHWEQGVRHVRTESDQSKIYLNDPKETLSVDVMPYDRSERLGTTRFGSGKATLYEESEKLRVDDDKYLRSFRNDIATVSKMYGDEDVRNYLFLKGEGYDIPPELAKLDKDKIMQRAIKNYIASYKKKGEQLTQVDAISDIWGYLNYIPMGIDRRAYTKYSKQFANTELARKNLMRYLMEGVYNSPKHLEWFKERFEQELKERIAKEREEAVAKGIEYKEKKLSQADYDAEFNAYLTDKAEAASKGYSDQGVSLEKHSDDYSDFSTGFSFTKERMPWNAAYVDRNGFSLNSLRADPVDTIERYNRRANGLIATKRVFGKTFDELDADIVSSANELFDKHHKDAKIRQRYIRDMRAMIRRAYGMNISDRKAYDAVDAFMALFKNGMFSTVGTFMGALNSGEIGMLVNSYGAGSLIRSIPGVGNIYSKLAKSGHLDKASIESIKKHIVGYEFNERLNLKAAIKEAEDNFEDMNPYLAKAVGASRFMAEHSPAGFVMRGFQGHINDVITDAVTSELITRALNTRGGIKGMFKDPKVFERLGITKDDIKYLNRVFRRYVTTNKAGSYSLKEGFETLADDDMFRDIFGRLHKYAFEECLQRRNPDDIFTWQLGDKSVMLDLAMQFKTFAIQSYNKRFVKMLNRIEDGDSLAMFNFTVTTTALSGTVNMLVSYTRSLGMEEEARNDYLDRTMGFHDFKDLDNPEVLSQVLFYNMINRNPIIAAFALAWNTAGIGTGGKTTASITDDYADSMTLGNFNVGKQITDMIPAARLIDSTADFGIGLYNSSIIAMDDEEDTYENRSKTSKQLLKGLNLLPSLPYLSPVLRDHVKDSLEEYKYGY